MEPRLWTSTSLLFFSRLVPTLGLLLPPHTRTVWTELHVSAFVISTKQQWPRCRFKYRCWFAYVSITSVEGPHMWPHKIHSITVWLPPPIWSCILLSPTTDGHPGVDGQIFTDVELHWIMEWYYELLKLKLLCSTNSWEFSTRTAVLCHIDSCLYEWA